MHTDFQYIGEVSIATSDTPEKIVQKSEELLKIGFNMLSFPDQARGDTDIATIEDIIKKGIFTKLDPNKCMPIVAARDKTEEEIISIANKLKSQGIKNLFLVSGDAHKSSTTNPHTSLSIIAKLAGDFNLGAVAHPDKVSLVRDVKKIKEGAKFLIAQATYNYESWSEWRVAAEKLGLNKDATIYQTIIPITNSTILNSLEHLAGVDTPDELINKLKNYNADELKNYGMTAAQSLINEIKSTNFFSGVYIYCKDLEVLRQIRFF